MKTITIDGVEYQPVPEASVHEFDSRSIVRTTSAGVFFGEVVELDLAAGTAVLSDARRLWYWKGAASLSQLATTGTSDPAGCKFPEPVQSVQLAGVIEVLPVTTQAAAAIDKAPVWSV